jgi:CheY-like chemotaxis protein
MQNDARMGGQRVLVVDDDEPTRTLLSVALAAEGYETTAVHDLSAARQLIERATPDLVITDVRVGLDNGLQLLAMAPVPIPAIVLTGFADPVIEADARRLGAEYLLKPIAPSALCAIVARKLSAARHGTFFCARQSPRRPLTPPLPLQVGETIGRLLDVSDSGARLQVERTVGAGLPPTLSLAVIPSGARVAAEVVWKRRVSDTVWECGVTVPPDAHRHWKTWLESLPDLTGNPSRTDSNSNNP